MLVSLSPLAQAFTAALFTWALTAAGAATVFVFTGYKRSFLDASLGFAAGVMTAASFWSLLLPALDIAEKLNSEGSKFFSLVPVVIGFMIGALFVHLTDILLPQDITNLVADSNSLSKKLDGDYKKSDKSLPDIENLSQIRQRNNVATSYSQTGSPARVNQSKLEDSMRLRRIVLMIIAVTVHNIPEGLAVGVGFGAIGKSSSATFASARNLAFGIGLQNFPEGLAVSLPLYASGFSHWKAFWYGQLSGMVEPLASVLGVLGVGLAEILLPYALSFAAGAMLYVVFENLMPEANSHGHGKLATWACLVGFCIMMSLDAGLG